MHLLAWPLALVLALATTGMPAPSPDTAAIVHGSLRCTVETPGRWGFAPDRGAETLRGCVSACRMEMSDPRVTGNVRMHLDLDCYGGRAFPILDHPADPGVALVASGALELTGPDGAWTGRFSGAGDADGLVAVYFVGAGTFAYRDWTFVAVIGPGAVDGIIYRGPAPACVGGTP